LSLSFALKPNPTPARSQANLTWHSRPTSPALRDRVAVPMCYPPPLGWPPPARQTTRPAKVTIPPFRWQPPLVD
jgi:hypothetical protein